MSSQDEILKAQLSEQIALEEHLCKLIEHQLSDIDESEFADASDLLKKASRVLEGHFTPLNELLDKLEQDALTARTTAVASNGVAHHRPELPEHRHGRISRILRDDYSALNLIAMSNTLLHTTALALDFHEVAEIALKHLKNLAPLVIKIGELFPEVVARELRAKSPKIDLLVGQLALKNTRIAWGKG